MCATRSQVYSAPFDAVAARYDEAFTESRIGKAQRNAVWAELSKAFQAGDRVLEIGCGTGVDACYLAERGVQVLACDPSTEMIAVTKNRIHERRLDTLIEPKTLRAEEISTLRRERFDGAFSNFGPMNCVEDLSQFARDLAQLLRPGATALLCWMNPCCLWEIVWYFAHGNTDKAFRRLRRGPVTARITDEASVDVHYPSVHFAARTFAPEFQLESVKGIGVAVPPSYLEPWVARHQRWMRFCELSDLWLGRCPGVRLLADHVLVRLRRSEYQSKERQ